MLAVASRGLVKPTNPRDPYDVIADSPQSRRKDVEASGDEKGPCHLENDCDLLALSLNSIRA
jgi:hypothetical protein